MDHLQRFARQVRLRLWAFLLTENIILLAGWWLGNYELHIRLLWLLPTIILVAAAGTILVTLTVSRYFTRPLRALWQAILHLAPDGGHVAAPQLEAIKFGHELIVGLTNHLYQLASVAEDTASDLDKQASGLSANDIASHLPLPLLVLDKAQNILFANQALSNYLHIENPSSIVGQNVYSLLDMLFPDKDTLETWLNKVQHERVTASRTWERVRLNLGSDAQPVLFDLAAYFSGDNPHGYEVLLVLFDHTNLYGQDEQSLSFLSLAVHELRTPITLLRGYVEALQEDVAGQLPVQDNEFMQRIESAGQQLAEFINNVLNVTRIEDNQFIVQLHEEDWPSIISSAVKDLELRAKLAGIIIETSIAPDLPKVGVDRLSMYEVLNNLLDNALKYSAKNSRITIKAHLTDEKLVETTIQDSGVGIPASVIPHLFEKFYRSHRSRTQVGGTGLGLYLCKTIIGAHGGNIWVRSHEGEGSTFGFTVVPYDQLSKERRAGQADFTRVAHGWIKNHSLYRR